MRNQQSLILYLFILIIIVVGFFLFLFKDGVADKILSYDVGVLNPINNNNTNNNLDLDILDDPRIKSFKSYVSDFNYSDLNKSQEALIASFSQGSDVVIVNPSDDNPASSTSRTFFRVRVGNSNPFLNKDK